MQQNHSRIDKSIFSIKYDDKGLAMRCNNLIESIFETKILPEMERSISNKISDEMIVQLDTLEIDIGTINEKDLELELAKRIKISLEQALHDKLNFKQGGLLKNDVHSNNKPHNYLIAALEFYLIKGYFPSWMRREVSFDLIVSRLIKTDQKDLIAMFRKYSGHASIMLRLSVGLQPKSFEVLVRKINPVNHEWVLDFRNRLNAIENKSVLSKYGRKGSLQMINAFILAALFDISSNFLNKIKFIEDVLATYMLSFSLKHDTLLHTIKTTNDTTEITKIIKETLQNQNTQCDSNVTNYHLDIKQFVTEINNLKHFSPSKNTAFFKQRIIDFIENSQTKTLLIETLNAKGTAHILSLFYPKKTKMLFNFIASFYRTLKKLNVNGQEKLFQSVQGITLYTIRYIATTDDVHFNYNLFFLSLISKIRIENEDTASHRIIKTFIHSQELLNSAVIEPILTPINSLQDHPIHLDIKTNPHKDINQFIRVVNDTHSLLHSKNWKWNRAQVIEFIRDETKRSILINTLNKNGLLKITELFIKQEAKALLKFITLFKNAFHKVKAHRPNQFFKSIEGLVLTSILYMNNRSDLTFDYNDFFLVITSIMGYHKNTDTKIINQFIESQNVLSQDRLNVLLVNKNDIEKRAIIKESVVKLIEHQEGPKDRFHGQTKTLLKTITVYKVKIISHYLTFGYLPQENEDLNQIDMQQLFHELLVIKDSFLVYIFQTDLSPTTLFSRLKFLIKDDNWTPLNNYILHYYKDSVELLIKLISEIKQVFKYESSLNLENKLVEHELIITSLITSRGHFKPSLFSFLIIRHIINSRSSQIDVSNKLIKTLKTSTLQNFTSNKNTHITEVENHIPNLEIQKVIEDDILKLIKHSGRFDLPRSSTNYNLRSKLSVLVHYLHGYPEDFRIVIMRNQIHILQVIILFRIHAPETTWKLFENTLSSQIVLKQKLNEFRRHTDDIFVALKDKTFNIVDVFINLSDSNSTRGKTIFYLIIKQNDYFSELHTAFKNKKMVLELDHKLKPFKNHLTALINFRPKAFSQNISEDFWSKLVFRFSIQFRVENIHISRQGFAKVFIKHVRNEFKAINKEALFYKVIFSLSTSKSKLLASLFGSIDFNDIKQQKSSAPILRHKKDSLNNHIDFHNLEHLNEEKQKEALVYIYNNTNRLEDFLHYLKTHPIPYIVLTPSKTNRDFLKALYNYSSELFINDVNWKSLILRIAIALRIEDEKYYESTFTKTFITQYKQKEITINHIDLPNALSIEMSESTNEILKKWSKTIKSIQNHETRLIERNDNDNDKFKQDLIEIRNLKSSISKNLFILSFYAHNSYFPWWSQTKSLSKLLDSIFDQSQSSSEYFEPIFMEIERDKTFIPHLISKLPANLIVVFSLISSKHHSINNKWIKSLSRVKSNLDETSPKIGVQSKEIPFKSLPNTSHIATKNYLDIKQLEKAIYFSTDEDILKQWDNNHIAIKNQILAYIKLSSYLYYHDLNPTKWKTFVYSFAFEYYRLKEAKLNPNFHKDLIHFLIQKNSNIPWKTLFKAVYSKSKAVLKNNIIPDGLLPFIGVKVSKEKQIKDSAVHNFEDDLEDVGNEIRVYNSGLIILWPFLSRFFEQLGLINNGEFIDDESKNRAIYLLQHITYNKTDFPEYELVLNKLLVGMPLREHVSPINELTKTELDLIASLMKGVIINWDKVKKSSSEAIQETFLQREGILQLKKEKNILIIEKKGVDALLSALPWNISLIKLPWMEKPLHIDWN